MGATMTKPASRANYDRGLPGLFSGPEGPRDRKVAIRRALQDLQRGRIDLDDLVDRFTCELGRGGRIVVIDHDLRKVAPLGQAAAPLRRDPRRLAEQVEAALCGGWYFTTEMLHADEPIEVAKRRLNCRVLVTARGEEFSSLADRQRHHYGLIWLVSRGDAATLAGRVEQAIVRAKLSVRPSKVVRV